MVKIGDLAQKFHSSAMTFLSTLGFELIEDPAEIRNPYGATVASYGSTRGLFLSVWFEPMDGRFASVAIGRRWMWDGSGYNGRRKQLRLSNDYHVLAKRLGLDVPVYYPLHYGSGFSDNMATIVEDLKRTLPIITTKTTLEDLIEIEAEKGGARWHYLKLGAERKATVEIETFDDGRHHESQNIIVKG